MIFIAYRDRNNIVRIRLHGYFYLIISIFLPLLTTLFGKPLHCEKNNKVISVNVEMHENTEYGEPYRKLTSTV